MPTVVTQMISLIDNPTTSANDVAKLISTDQALTAKMLKLANSAFYGFPRDSLEDSLGVPEKGLWGCPKESKGIPCKII